MNRSKFFIGISTLTISAVFVLMLALTRGVEAQAKPDLRVTAINTPGGLCKGNTNKIQVTIQNSQNIGINQPVQAILHISFPNGGQGQYTSATTSGIGPNGNQPVWFHNVSLPDTGNYSFKVIADPANNVIESVENNNTFALRRTVEKPCGQPAPPKSYALNIKVYQRGTWQGGQGQWIQGATVKLKKEYDSSFPEQTATTNSNGQVSFSVPAGSLYRFTATKPDCNSLSGSPTTPGSSSVYQMGTYDTIRYLELDCNK